MTDTTEAERIAGNIAKVMSDEAFSEEHVLDCLAALGMITSFVFSDPRFTDALDSWMETLRETVALAVTPRRLQ